MYYLNKIVGAFLNPLGIGLLLLMATVAFRVRREKFRVQRKKFRVLSLVFRVKSLALALLLFSVVWLWIWSTGAMGRWIGLSLEREFPPQTVEQMPTADAIVVLGGGAGMNTNACPYVKLMGSADRAWHGARLYKAGKAPKVFVTTEADALFMIDLGVPREAITVNDKARNTEEEARLIAGAMKRVQSSQTVSSLGFSVQSSDDNSKPQTLNTKLERPKVLLVTSAWHMRRALLMYRRYAKDVEVVPAATDYVNMTMFGRPLEFVDFIPDPCMIGQNAYMFKEWLAFYGYYFLRK